MTRRAGLIGHPVEQSVSPRFQQAAFRALGIDARYEAWDILPEQLAACVQGLRAPDVLGANVTIPHKQTVMALLDSLEDTARAVGAVNTIVNRNGALDGANTDVEGFRRALADLGASPRDTRVVIWGAGGAARAVAWALLRDGAATLTIVNRSAARARALAADLAPAAAAITACAADEPAAREALRRCTIAVHCTPVGMRGTGTEHLVPFPATALPPEAVVMDLVANPLHTRLLADCKTAGIRAIGGLPMLVYQGAAAFERWTGQAAPLAVMFAAAERATREAALP